MRSYIAQHAPGRRQIYTRMWSNVSDHCKPYSIVILLKHSQSHQWLVVACIERVVQGIVGINIRIAVHKIRACCTDWMLSLARRFLLDALRFLSKVYADVLHAIELCCCLRAQADIEHIFLKLSINKHFRSHKIIEVALLTDYCYTSDSDGAEPVR